MTAKAMARDDQRRTARQHACARTIQRRLADIPCQLCAEARFCEGSKYHIELSGNPESYRIEQRNFGFGVGDRLTSRGGQLAIVAIERNELTCGKTLNTNPIHVL